MTTQIDAPALDLARVEEFAGQVAGHAAIAYNGVLVYLGDRLGLCRALASVESATSHELAERSGLAERYVRSGSPRRPPSATSPTTPATGSFSLPAEHAMVLADEDSPAFGAATFEVITGVHAATDKLAHAYATGDGVGWHEHDSRVFTGVERFFGTLYRNSLIAEWLPAVDGLAERLEAGIRVVDVGCGLGTATIMLAEAFPKSRFVGVDYHEESIQPGNRGRGGGRGLRPGALPRRRRLDVLRAATTWCASSTPCTTWATRSARSRTLVRRCGPEARCSRSSRSPRTRSRTT